MRTDKFVWAQAFGKTHRLSSGTALDTKTETWWGGPLGFILKEMEVKRRVYYMWKHSYFWAVPFLDDLHPWSSFIRANDAVPRFQQKTIHFTYCSLILIILATAHNHHLKKNSTSSRIFWASQFPEGSDEDPTQFLCFQEVPSVCLASIVSKGSLCGEIHWH